MQTKNVFTRACAVLLLGSALAAGVVACSTVSPEPRPTPSLTYQKYPAIKLNVAQIQVVDNYTASLQSPNIEGQMAAPLPNVVHDWAAKRFIANGQDGTLVITIDKASVVTDSLHRTSGLKGVVTIDQAQKFTGEIAVRFNVSNTSFGKSGQATVGAKATNTVPENASLQQQDGVLADLTQALITELDAGSQRVFNDKLPMLMQQGGVNAGFAGAPANNAPMNGASMPASNF